MHPSAMNVASALLALGVPGQVAELIRITGGTPPRSEGRPIQRR